MKKFSQYLTPEEKEKNLSITEKAWLSAKEKAEAEIKLQKEQKLQEQLDREEQERKSIVLKIKDLNTIVEERIGDSSTEPAHEEILSEADDTVEEVRSIMIEGPPGSQGDKGDTGEQGPQGVEGPKGDKGDTGEQGPKGDKGDRGDIGIQGFSGSKGEQGIPGSNGERGPQGDIGAVGPQGEKGDQGEIGPQGIQGIQGEKGDKGDQGDKGDTGQDGLQGLKGDKGDIGLKGEIGSKGDKGDVGEKGLDGKDGKDGRDGIDGKDGVNGKNGTTPDIKKLHEKIDKYLTSMNFGSGGGSGSSWLNDLGDTDYTSLVNAADGQVLTYNETVKKWIASTLTASIILPTQTGNANKYLKTDGTALSWAAGDGTGTVTSVGGTGTVNGLSLSGTVTTSGNLTLGGTLDLSTPPTIGNTTPNTGAFTTLIGGGSSANYGQLTGGATTKAVEFKTIGSDTNVGLAILSQGTGAIDLAAGSRGVNISNGGTVTAITRTAGGTGYTVAPTVTISAPTTAGGVQATATCTVTAGVVDTAFTITNAGSGYVEQPTITFTPVSGGSGATAYATVGSVTTIKSIGSSTTGTTLASIQFVTPNSANPNYPPFTIRDIANSDTGLIVSPNTGYAQLFAGNASNSVLMLGSAGTSSIYFNTQGSSQTNQMRVSHTASAVNYVQVTGAATSGTPVISSQGSDTNINLRLTPKGTGTLLSATAATILDGTAIPAGGTAGSGYKFSSTANFGIFFGSGAPTLSAAQGSLYLRSDGSSTLTRLYVNTNGSTTWTNVTTAA